MTAEQTEASAVELFERFEASYVRTGNRRKWADTDDPRERNAWRWHFASYGPAR